VTTGRMHAGEADIDGVLVRRLLAAQFPQWAELPIEALDSAGTDNALYRLGAHMVVRLPRIRGATSQIARDHEWLPRLAPRLPLAIPEPLALGRPAEGYPWPWAVHRWLEGAVAAIDRLDDPHGAAASLGEFVAALQRIDPTDAPAWARDASRGRPLATRDAEVRRAIAALRRAFDPRELTAAWDDALRAPVWKGPPVWFHGDLHTTNLLARDGRLTAVIDFGCLGVGDPACDAMPAWIHLSAATRDTFRAALAVDDATWARGRGWALSVGLIALPYYETTNPVFAGIARHAVEQAVADRR
jgi:aminoglycoside phosphotransferase (APT) family kinase protein